MQITTHSHTCTFDTYCVMMMLMAIMMMMMMMMIKIMITLLVVKLYLPLMDDQSNDNDKTSHHFNNFTL